MKAKLIIRVMTTESTSPIYLDKQEVEYGTPNDLEDIKKEIKEDVATKLRRDVKEVMIDSIIRK